MFDNRDHKLSPDPVPRAVGLLFLAGSSIFDIHTIALSNCVEYMVDVVTRYSWYRQNISAKLLSENKLFYLSYQYHIFSNLTIDYLLQTCLFSILKLLLCILLTDNQTLVFTLQDNIHIHKPYGIVSCAFVCLVTVITTKAHVRVPKVGRSLFLARSCIFDIHTIVFLIVSYVW